MKDDESVIVFIIKIMKYEVGLNILIQWNTFIHIIQPANAPTVLMI